jgi:MFS family permease
MERDQDLSPVTISSNPVRLYIGMVIIATLNNLPYWVAISNAQAIVHHFDKQGFLGAVTWACVFFGMFGTSMNTLLSAKSVSYNIRAIVNGIFMSAGLVGTAFSRSIYMAIPCIAFVGLSSDFGEGVMLGYFASMSNNSLMRAWGVGTGISGILGAGYAFLCQFFEVSYFISFLVLSPSGLIYALVFIFMLDTESPANLKHDDIPDEHEEGADISELDVIAEPMINTHDSENVRCCSVAIWKKTWYYFVMNSLCFFFQYSEISGITDCSMSQEQREKNPYIYGLLTLCFQIGSFFGRASLRWIRIRLLWVLALVLGFLFVFGLFDVAFRFMPIWLKIGVNAVLGVTAGLAYVNVFNQVMNDPNATVKEREIMSNLTSIGIAGNIMLASMFTLLMQNTFFKRQCVDR